MTTLQIDTGQSRADALRVGQAGEAFDRAASLVDAAMSVAHVPEAASAAGLLTEAAAEAAMTARVFALAADRADVADSGFRAMLDGWVAGSLDALHRSLLDDDGAHGIDLALGRAGPNGLAHSLANTFSRQEAAEWFASLSEAERVALVAAAESEFADTMVALVIQSWKAQLDTEGVRALYTERAFHAAGIDPAAWDPSLGLDHNAPIVESVYEYYAELYRSNPDRLWWSGMAALIGPSFYGGFRDLDTFQDILRVAEFAAETPMIPLAPAPPGFGDLLAFGSAELGDELAWYQRQLLEMQREIFLDMAPAHEAYLDGGVDEIARLYADDPHAYGAETIAAWRQVDEGWLAGDTDMIAEGNATLLWREQAHVIADDYDHMRDRPVTGEFVTWAMTAIGAPSVPGASGYAEVFPLTVSGSASASTPDHMPLPWLPDPPLPHVEIGASAEVTTPFPDGNISRLDDRWALIEADTLPVYVDLAQHHPERVLAELDIPVGERADDYEIDARIDDILEAFLTDWDLDGDLDIDLDW